MTGWMGWEESGEGSAWWGSGDPEAVDIPEERSRGWLGLRIVEEWFGLESQL